MIDAGAAAALAGGAHADPFAVLGLHAAGDGALWLRALLPQAQSVAVVDAATGAELATLARVHPDGLYEARIPRRRKPFDYRLRVQWSDGTTQDLADAYAFGPQLDDADLHALR